MNCICSIKNIRNFFGEWWKRRAEWYQVVMRCRVSLICVMLIVGCFVALPAAQDILRSMAQPEKGWNIVWFELLLVVWAFVVWYGGRILLNYHFDAIHSKKREPDKQLQTLWGRQPRTLWGESAWPRILGVTGILGVGTCAMWNAVSGLSDVKKMRYGLIWWLGIVNIVLGVLYYKFLSKGRRYVCQIVVKRIKRDGPIKDFFNSHLEEKKNRIVSIKDIPGLLLWFIWISSGIILGLLIGVWADLEFFAALLGTTPILLLGCVVLIVFATWVIYVGEYYKFPIIIVILFLVAIFNTFNDNHSVRMLEGVENKNQERFYTATELVKHWIEKNDLQYGKDKKHPMFIVAASGGGIKAAYWTASVLGLLQDENASFARHTIVISSVSGGTLGALVFANLVNNDVQSGHCASISQSILSQDFLAPTMGALFFYDMPARLLPYSKFIPDRATILETAWERAWESTPYRDIFEAPFSTLIPGERDHKIPTLLINGTSVENGGRLLTTHLNLDNDFPLCECFEDIIPHQNQKGADIRMSTAATMSARFPIISPAGTTKQGKHVVDGGYFDNSGDHTILQFLESLEKEIPDFNEKVEPILIQINNDYGTSIEKSHTFFPGIQFPIDTFLNTVGAHAADISKKLQNKCEEKGWTYYVYDFDKPKIVEAPLSWFLSKASQCEIKDQLTTGTNIANSKIIGERLKHFNEMYKKNSNNPW